MNIHDIIKSALSIAEKYQATAQIQKLNALSADINADKLKVVVLGDFKAGKSTLLNRLFVRKNLLPTDYQEATAVPTHLSNGSMSMNTWMRNPDGEDILVTERLSFSDSDVAATVTAATEAERADKASRYSKVCITMPGILPDGIVLVDTPGLNTTNTAIYTGTLAEARTADAILYVVRAKQLSSREEALIVDLAGSQNLKVPMHVVLTHDAAANIAEAQLMNICQTIKAQLKLRGVDCGVSTFSLSDDGSASAPIVEKIQTSFVDDWGWETPEPQAATQGGADSWDWDAPATTAAPAQPEPQATTQNLEAELLDFFNGEVKQGRMARISRELKPVLASLKATVSARLALAGAKEEELKQIEAKKVDIKREYLRVVESLLLDVRSAQLQFSNDVEGDLDELRKSYEKQLNQLTSTGQILTCISDWQKDIPESLQRALAKRKLDLQRDINAISLKHQQKLIGGLSPESVQTKMPSDWLTKLVSFMPNWLLLLSDFIIFEWISPLPGVLDVIVRMIADRIPLIRDIMPANLAAAMARKMAISKLGECVQQIKQQVREQLDAKFEELNAKLHEALVNADIFAEQDAAIAEVRKGTLTLAQKAQLQTEMDQVTQWGVNI